MQFMVQQDMAKQLQSVQRDGVMQFLNSPRSSLVIMVKNKVGSDQFCVEYLGLNSVTRSDVFPLTHSNEFGPTWMSQVILSMRPGSMLLAGPDRATVMGENSIYCSKWSYEFWVLSFGLTNVSVIFQQFM